MYASNMWKHFYGAPLLAVAAWMLASCHNAAPKTAAPTPEARQNISESLKELYMAASAAPPKSAKQQKIILEMAEKASNGKELLLVMRAAVGVFPPGADPQAQTAEARLHSMVTAKMMQLATLDQLTEYEAHYPVDPPSVRPYVERMLQLGNENSDPRVWRRITLTALHLKVSDLEQQAQAKADRLAGR